MNEKTISELRTKVYEAVGESSMTWNPIPSGIYDSTRAKGIGDRLMDEILSRFTTTEDKGGDKGHMPFKEYFASLPVEEQEAAKAEFKKMQYRSDQSQICQAQGAACISCDLVNCGDRIYGRRK